MWRGARAHFVHTHVVYPRALVFANIRRPLVCSHFSHLLANIRLVQTETFRSFSFSLSLSLSLVFQLLMLRALLCWNVNSITWITCITFITTTINSLLLLLLFTTTYTSVRNDNKLVIGGRSQMSNTKATLADCPSILCILACLRPKVLQQLLSA